MWNQDVLNKNPDITGKNISISAKSERWWKGNIERRTQTLGRIVRRNELHSEVTDQ